MPPVSSQRWILALCSLASFMFALDALVVTTALGAIHAELGAPIGMLAWIVNAYNLGFAVLLMTGAALGDRFGRRRMLSLGLLLFVAASAACAAAGGTGWLIAARALQGAGAALAMPVAMALLSAAYPPRTRAAALGIFGSITGLALIIGPAVGGALAQGLAWRWIFWINIPIGLVAVVLVQRRIPVGERSSAALDLPGVLLAAASILCLLWAGVRGHDAGWTSLEVAGALFAGLLLAAGFVRREQLAPAPMVPLRLFRSRRFGAGIAASFLFYGAMYATLFFLPQFFQSQGVGPLQAGLQLIPWTATLFVVAPPAGRLVNRWGERALVAAGLLLQAAGMAWIALIAAPGLAYAQLVLPLLLSGAGVSMAIPAAQNAVMSAVPAADIGKASGVFNMLRYLGGVFGIALLVEIFARGASSGPADAAFSHGFAQAMGAGALLALFGALAALHIPSHPPAIAGERLSS